MATSDYTPQLVQLPLFSVDQRAAHPSHLRRLRAEDIPGWDSARVEALVRSKTERREPGECWLWRGYWDRDGRASVNVGGRSYVAARIVYVLVHGEIPAGMWVCHNCPGGDDPRCVNPAHLALGTPTHNNRDTKRKGRWGNNTTGKTRKAVLRYCRPAPPTLVQRLEAGLMKGEPDACWLWTRGSASGYGRVGGTSTHRLAYTLAYGPIPRGLVVRHLCEGRYAPGDLTYRRCCNPAHLAVGSHAENMRDSAANGRHPRGERHYARLEPWRLARGAESGARLHPDRRPHGVTHGCARLTEEDVRALRAGWDAGEPTPVLAARFGISIGHAISVGARRAWRHLDAGAEPAPGTIQRPRNHTSGERHWAHQHPERVPRGERHYLRQHPEKALRGARNGHARLADDDIRHIRSAHAAGQSKKELAALYGVSSDNIGLIVRRRTWRYVE